MAPRLPFHGSQLKFAKPSVLVHQNTTQGYGSIKYNKINNINKTFFGLKQTTIQTLHPVPTTIDSFARWSNIDRKKRSEAHRDVKKQKLAEKKELKRAMMMSQEVRDPLVLQAYKEIEDEDMGKKVETKKGKRISEDEEDNILIPHDELA